MNTQFALDACGLEALDDAAMMTVSGGLLGGWQEILYKATVGLVVCLATNVDSIIDGAVAGYEAATT
ncbi:MAG TPA: hypothetical protein VF166_07185 [Gemmatimonadaceae bacterium]